VRSQALPPAWQGTDSIHLGRARCKLHPHARSVHRSACTPSGQSAQLSRNAIPPDAFPHPVRVRALSSREPQDLAKQLGISCRTGPVHPALLRSDDPPTITSRHRCGGVDVMGVVLLNSRYEAETARRRHQNRLSSYRTRVVTRSNPDFPLEGPLIVCGDAIGGRTPIAELGRRGADHESDDEGAAFCRAQISASGQGAVRSGDGGGERCTDTGDGNRSAMCGTT
jgi:hypothetical protein